MAHYGRIKFQIKSCPACGASLFKVAEGDIIIDSPLVECKACGQISYTKHRSEWYNHPKRWMLWGIPLILVAATILFLLLTGYDPTVILSLAIIWIIAIVITAKDVVRVIKSKRRMRDSRYLARLLQCHVITQEEYETFIRDAQQ